MRLETIPNIQDIEEMVKKRRENEALHPRPLIIDYFERLYEYNGNERYLQMIDTINQALDIAYGRIVDVTGVPRDTLNYERQ